MTIQKKLYYLLVTCFMLTLVILFGYLRFISSTKQVSLADDQSEAQGVQETVSKKLFPDEGFQSKIRLDDAIPKLVEGGMIDPEKFMALYEQRGGLPTELASVLTQSDDDNMLITLENSGIYLNLLWALGVANYMDINLQSPINGENLYNFASTGGWTLGKESNGGFYFNKIKAVELTPEQEALVFSMAENIFRPCCGNSTFFQDCNHGSAMLGLLALGVAQGLSEDELYKEALVFNSYWFPSNYTEMAIYYKTFEKKDWSKIDPRIALSRDFSSGAGWRQNIHEPLTQIPGLLPQSRGGSACNV